MDLNPNNFLVSNGKVYLIDFGLAMSITAPETRYEGLTPEFFSPEILSHDLRYCMRGSATIFQKSDIFNVGLILYYMYFKVSFWNTLLDWRYKAHSKIRYTEKVKAYMDSREGLVNVTQDFE